MLKQIVKLFTDTTTRSASQPTEPVRVGFWEALRRSLGAVYC